MGDAGPLSLWRNLGNDWADVTADRARRRSRCPTTHGAARLARAATWTATATSISSSKIGQGETRVLLNDGGNRAARCRALAGRVSNRSGVGSKIELRAGSLRQKLETASAWPAAAPADILFGLGSRPAADVVRVLWPAGILQAEIPDPRQSPRPQSAALPVASRQSPVAQWSLP